MPSDVQDISNIRLSPCKTQTTKAFRESFVPSENASVKSIKLSISHKVMKARPSRLHDIVSAPETTNGHMYYKVHNVTSSTHEGLATERMRAISANFYDISQGSTNPRLTQEDQKGLDPLVSDFQLVNKL